MLMHNYLKCKMEQKCVKSGLFFPFAWVIFGLGSAWKAFFEDKRLNFF